MRLKGEWEEGQFKDGKWILSNGDYFQGRFDSGLPIGEGVWNRKGTQMKGIYEPMDVKKKEVVPTVTNDIYNDEGWAKQSNWSTIECI